MKSLVLGTKKKTLNPHFDIHTLSYCHFILVSVQSVCCLTAVLQLFCMFYFHLYFTANCLFLHYLWLKICCSIFVGKRSVNKNRFNCLFLAKHWRVILPWVLSAGVLTGCTQSNTTSTTCVLPENLNAGKKYVFKSLATERTVMTAGDSDEKINILINSQLLPSGFWWLDTERTQFREILVH